MAEAVDAAKDSDVVVVFAGLNPHLEGEEMTVSSPGFSGGDRTELQLPDPQERLIREMVGAGKPVVVVLSSGSAIAANYAAEHAAAVLESWYSGEQGGTAIAETLAGANNPAGRLPVTVYRSAKELPPFTDYSMEGRTYRYFRGEPLYPFGYGLSYSTFGYSDLKTESVAEGRFKVSVRVTNKSSCEGDEVVQLYVSLENKPGAPVRDLRGFERVHLVPGETRIVEFALNPEEFGDQAGPLRISAGGGQPIAKWSTYVETVLPRNK
jgi:beta-glucosidase